MGNSKTHAKNPKTLRVLLLSRPFTHVGGVRTWSEYLLKHHYRERFEIIHIGIGKPTPFSPFWKRPFEYGSSIIRVLAAVKDQKPDLVHINPSLIWRSLPLHLTLSFLIKVTSSVPVLLHFRGWDTRIGAMLSRRTLLGRILDFIIDKADHHVVLAYDFKNTLIGAGINPEKISVLPNMVDVKAYAPPEEKEIESGAPLQLLFIGRLVAGKGVWDAIDAVDWLHQYYPDVKVNLIVAGQGKELPKIERLISENRGKGRISTLGAIFGQDKIEAFTQSDILLFPSQDTEGLPNVILEALASGLALIYTPIAALGEALSDQNGICLEVGDLDAESLGRAVLSLYYDVDKRRAMSQANRELAKEKYDVHIVCRKIERVYEHVMEKGA